MTTHDAERWSALLTPAPTMAVAGVARSAVVARLIAWDGSQGRPKTSAPGKGQLGRVAPRQNRNCRPTTSTSTETGGFCGEAKTARRPENEPPPPGVALAGLRILLSKLR